MMMYTTTILAYFVKSPRQSLSVARDPSFKQPATSLGMKDPYCRKQLNNEHPAVVRIREMIQS